MMNDSPVRRQPVEREGLCRTCRHARAIVTDRGHPFLLCERSRTDPAYPRYPALPVLVCRGFETGEVG
jgi:hypothetical protein